jgi:hypothetical protein
LRLRLYGVFTRKVWTRRKAKTPTYLPLKKEGVVACLAVSSEMLPKKGFTEDVYGEEEKDPKPQKKTINMATKSSPLAYPKQVAFHVDSSYQYPLLAECLCCYLKGRSIVLYLCGHLK